MSAPLACRRRENCVVSCLACGTVRGIYVEGEQPVLEEHECMKDDAPAELGSDEGA